MLPGIMRRASRQQWINPWAALGCLVILLAVLQWRLVSMAPQESGNEAPPNVVRIARPERVKNELPPGTTPAEAFAERLARGLSPREVRWIIEDFENADIGGEVRAAETAEFLSERRRQHRWLLGLLKQGLALRPDQEREVVENLNLWFDRAARDFSEEVGSLPTIEVKGREMRVVPGEIVSRVIEPGRWLKDDACAPWNLCELTSAQMQLVLPMDADEEILPGDGWWEAGRDGDPARLIFTVAPGTVPPSSDGLEAALTLHPAQLKSLLLIEPSHVARLREELAAAGE